MNPLSTWTFYRRHKKRAVLLLGLISLVTAGLYLMGALTWAVFTEPTRANYLYLSKINIVMPPSGIEELDPSVAPQVRTHPGVERVLPTFISMGIGIPEAMGGQNNWINLLALQEEDVPYILEKCEATLIEGQMLRPQTNGIVLSNKVAAALDVQVGDVIHNGVDLKRYRTILEPMEVVGILESDMRLGILSYEYVSNHELYRDNLTPQFIVVAQPGHELAVDSFLLDEIKSTRVKVLTFQDLMASLARDYQQTTLLALPVAVFAAIAVTLVVGVANRMALTERLPEFGILHAAGHAKRWLARRLTAETAVLASVGWGAGILLSRLTLYLIEWTLFAPRGHDLTVTWAPVILIIPVPITVVAFTLLSARRTFARLDTVTIVEQGELGPESGSQRKVTSSQAKPLSSLTFFRRHKRRAVLLTGAMSLVIVAIALLIFVFAASGDALEANLGDLLRTSIVAPLPGSDLDPGTVAQVRTHPSVERVIPYTAYGLFNIFIPPFSDSGIGSYGLYEEDMHYLVELYDLELQEGQLPRPYTNEVVIPKAVAQNRDLEVGDVLGDPDHPAYPGAPNLPTEFVISGIFAASPAGEENWFSFISLEFLESHEAFEIPEEYVYPLVVVPQAGQKDALDDWLETRVAGDDVLVLTYRQQYAEHQTRMRTLLLTMGMMEVVFTVVTAVALAVLNYISVSQRRSELGVLSALGHGNWRLVGRLLRETTFTTGTAWGISIGLCLLGMLAFRSIVFVPLGLTLNLINPIPWLFTLPIPIVVLVVTSGTVARTLSKLDPVSIIERR
ncbi:MAG: ABC transporter permease [Chloroflexi bacterium]|nr:ABC transporter permease [Chloroflexota bacterium]